MSSPILDSRQSYEINIRCTHVISHQKTIRWVDIHNIRIKTDDGWNVKQLIHANCEDCHLYWLAHYGRDPMESSNVEHTNKL